jgi:hypothetical protein
MNATTGAQKARSHIAADESAFERCDVANRFRLLILPRQKRVSATRRNLGQELELDSPSTPTLLSEGMPTYDSHSISQIRLPVWPL